MKRLLTGMGFSCVYGIPPDQPGACLPVWNWQKLVVDPLRKFLSDMMAFIPDVLLAICILVTGWVVGRVLQLIVMGFLKAIGFDAFAQRTGMTGLWGGSEKIAPHRWVGLLVFWIAMFSSFVLSLDQLRLRIASSGLNQLFHFTLMVITVLVIFGLGMFLALVCSKMIRVFAQQLKVEKPEVYAVWTRGIILAFTILACLIHIGVPETIIFGVVGTGFLTLCLAFILAFGLGGRAWAGKMLDKFIR